MGAVYFNGNSSSNSVFYRIKPLVPNLSILSGSSAANVVPVLRSGISRYFTVTRNSISLFNGDTNTLISTTTSTSVITGGFFSKLYLSSVDECLYGIVVNASLTNYQLIKFSDTTGALTSIGSIVVFTSTNNWGFGQSDFGFMDSTSADRLRVIANGKVSTLSSLTGEVITEGVPLALSGYGPAAVNPVCYINADGNIGADFFMGDSHRVDTAPAVLRPSLSTVSIPHVVSAVCGVRPPQNVAPYSFFTTQAECSSFGAIAADSDKIIFVTDLRTNPITSHVLPCKVIYRADWDRFLRSVVDYHAGLI